MFKLNITKYLMRGSDLIMKPKNSNVRSAKRRAVILAAMLVSAIILSGAAYAADDLMSSSASTGTQKTPESSYTPVSNALNIIRNSLELKKTALVNTEITFSPEEFEKILGVKKLSSITIKSLPDISTGVLIAGNQEVTVGQTISRENLKYLRIVPYPDRLGKITFTFSNTDSKSDIRAAGNEIDIKCAVSVLDSLNFAPSASSFEVSTQKNIALVKAMQAYEPDNDLVRYSIVASPKKGKLIISDESLGSFIYIPNSNYTGKDSFKYVAIDEYGNESNIATATIKVVKPAANVFFADLKNHWAHNSAIKAVGAGFVDASSTEFYPDSLVSRSEFVKMAVIAAKQDKNLSGVNDTGFADDDSIPSEYKSYIKRAYDLGYIKGTATDTGVYFNPNNALTRAEAAVIINKILAIPATEIKSGIFSGINVGIADAVAIPSWAADDINSLYVNGIIKGEGNGKINAEGYVNKAQAVELLCNMVDYTAAKAKSNGFLSFLFK